MADLVMCRQCRRLYFPDDRPGMVHVCPGIKPQKASVAKSYQVR